MPLKEGIVFFLFIFITSSAGTIISVSYIIKCWICKSGDERKTKHAKSYQPGVFTTHSVLTCPCTRGSVTYKNRFLSMKIRQYHQVHETEVPTCTYNQEIRTYTKMKVPSPSPHPICSKIKLHKFQLKNTSFVYFLGSENIHENLEKKFESHPFNVLELTLIYNFS